MEHKAIPQIPQELNFHEESQSEIQDGNAQENDGSQAGVQQSDEEAEDIEQEVDDGFEQEQNVGEDSPSQMNDNIITVQPAKPNTAED